MSFFSWFYTLRSYIDSYLGFLKGTRILSLIWVVAICVVIWFYGEAFALGSWRPLATVEARLWAIGAVVALWLVYLVVSLVRARRAARALIDDVTGEPIEDPDAAAREEVSELQARLRDALGRMRQVTRKRFDFVYDLPWYMLIGAPGSGKTTALLNAGLKFPLGDDVDNRVRGVGGTRNCDWWFTDDAILIDTAGRYTTHDSDQSVDQAGWLGFLGLLKKNRPLKPVNGVVVTFSMEDMLLKSPQARLADVRTLRQRLRDLEDNLKVRLPVYLVFTKVDVVAGFAEFFDAFNRFDREQVLGTTFPLGVSQSRGKVAEAFEAEYDIILERLNRVLIERMQQEPDDVRRSRVFRFPAQFAALKATIVEQVAELTAASRLVRAPLLRGVYFASATQSGQVFDRSRAAVSERFSFLPDVTGGGPTGEKSFFLQRLFSDVIFGEANLVTTDLKMRRRKRVMAGLLYGVPTLAALALLFGWTSAWFANNETIQAVNTRIAAYNRDAAVLPAVDVASDDVMRTIEPLDQLAAALTRDIPGTDRWYHFGVDQEEKLASGVRASYERALNGLLLPRLLVLVQDAIDQDGIAAGDLYRRLKLYLMLGGAGPLDRDFVRTTVAAELERVVPGTARAPQREALLAHVAALVSDDTLRPITLDQGLVDEARAALRDASPAERVYEIVRESPLVAALKPWSPGDRAGSGAALLLERSSGLSLNEGLPGFYTRAGFYDAVLPELDRVTGDLLREPWVLGEDYLADVRRDDVKRDVLRRYLAEREREWSRLVADLRLRDVADLTQAASVVGILTSRNNPLIALLRALGEASNLDPALPAAVAAAAGADTATGGAAADLAGEATDAVASASAAPPPVPASAYLLEDFAPNLVDPYAELRAFVTGQEDQPSGYDGLGEAFELLFRELTRAINTSDVVRRATNQTAKLAAANQALVTEAQRVPPPLDRWIGTLASQIARLSASGVRQDLSQLWQSTGGRFCEAAIAGRYPVRADAPNDVAINDFVRMFGPGGEMKTFFDLHLAPYVDRSQSPWRWVGGAGNEAVASEALRQFEIAERIRSAFFADGAGLSVAMDVTPVELGANSDAVLLSLNDQKVSYDHGPVETSSLQWPGTGNRAARITFQPPGRNVSRQRTGPWAVFRLFDEAKVDAATDDKFRATFRLGDRSATFDVQTGSVLNPFSLPELQAFRCPQEL